MKNETKKNETKKLNPKKKNLKNEMEIFKPKKIKQKKQN